MFKCPWCESEVWGTDATRNMGVCHGWKSMAPDHAMRHCEFEWERSRENDAKVGIEYDSSEPVTAVSGHIQELKRAHLHVVK